MNFPINAFEAPEMARSAANFSPLAPVTFLNRAALVHPDKVAVIDGRRRYSWRQVQRRVMGLAEGLKRTCPQEFETIAVLAANVSELFELLFAAPGCLISCARATLSSLPCRELQPARFNSSGCGSRQLPNPAKTTCCKTPQP